MSYHPTIILGIKKKKTLVILSGLKIWSYNRQIRNNMVEELLFNLINSEWNYLFPYFQHLLSQVLVLTVLTWIRRYLEVILICISKTAKNREHIFRYFLAIIIYLHNLLFRFIVHFLIEYFSLNLLFNLYIQDINLLSDMKLAKYF